MTDVDIKIKPIDVSVEKANADQYKKDKIKNVEKKTINFSDKVKHLDIITYANGVKKSHFTGITKNGVFKGRKG